MTRYSIRSKMSNRDFIGVSYFTRGSRTDRTDRNSESSRGTNRKPVERSNYGLRNFSTVSGGGLGDGARAAFGAENPDRRRRDNAAGRFNTVIATTVGGYVRCNVQYDRALRTHNPTLRRIMLRVRDDDRSTNTGLPVGSPPP